MTTPLIRFDAASFDPWRIQAVEHALDRHALLQFDSLIELSRRLEARKQVRSHTDAARAGTPFHSAPNLHPNARSAAETLAAIERAGAWTSLLNVQTDEVYRTLVDQALDDVRPRLESRDPGMSYRGGWIFVTSPRAVTPFHIDHEHNFILQIHGRKRVYVWDPRDRSVVSELGLELFHAKHSRDMVRWSEELRAKARVFDFEPGMGAYMPSTTPHMVENGDGASVTVSFTYYTRATRRRALVYRGHHLLRRFGLAPAPVGTSAWRDGALHALMRAYVGVREPLSRLRGQAVYPTSAPYAFARYA